MYVSFDKCGHECVIVNYVYIPEKGTGKYVQLVLDGFDDYRVQMTLY